MAAEFDRIKTSAQIDNFLEGTTQDGAMANAHAVLLIRSIQGAGEGATPGSLWVRQERGEMRPARGA